MSKRPGLAIPIAGSAITAGLVWLFRSWRGVPGWVVPAIIFVVVLGSSLIWGRSAQS